MLNVVTLLPQPLQAAFNQMFGWYVTIGIKRIKISVPSSQILVSKQSTPIALVAAPGLGSFFDIISVCAFINSDIPYDTSTQVFISAGSDAIWKSDPLFLNNNSGALFQKFERISLGSETTNLSENSPIFFWTGSVNPINGNEIVDLYITYTTIKL